MPGTARAARGGRTDGGACLTAVFHLERALSQRPACAAAPCEPIASATDPGPARWPRRRVAYLAVSVLALCGVLAVASLSARGISTEGEVRLLVAAARASWEQHDFHRKGARAPGTGGNAV